MIDMNRNNTVTSAALFGFVGTILMSIGGVLASASITMLDLWFGVILAFLVWSLFVFFAMKQFANGIYTIVEDAKLG